MNTSSSNNASLRRQPKQKRSQQRVERILQAAAELFASVGYEAATTHAIAARAGTAIGSLYQFFPDKLAIFHALEERHMEQVRAIHAQLMTPQMAQQPLESMVQQIVETFAVYFEHPGPKVVYIQYCVAPEMFKYFDESFNQSLIQEFATLLRLRNPALSRSKSQLLAEVCLQCYNSLLLVALRSDLTHRKQLYEEMQELLLAYLRPYVGDEVLRDDGQSLGGTRIPYDRPLAKVEITSSLKLRLNPPLSRGEKLEILPPPLSNRSFSEERAGEGSIMDFCKRSDVLCQQYQLSQRQYQALIFAIKQGGLTIQNFEEICPKTSRRTLQRELRDMVEKGLLLPEGKTNRLYYRLNPLWLKLATSCDNTK